MSKYEAVDRLMELASEKRADRVAQGAPAAQAAAEPAARETTPAASADQSHPRNGQPPSVAARGRQMFYAIRPLLPAVAGAMRMVDHGAVQAIARFLPLLGGSPGGPPVSAPRRALSPEQEQALEQIPGLQTASESIRRELNALSLRAAAVDDLMGRTRTHLERLLAEQTLKEDELRSLQDRVRVLSAGVIILLMLTIAQMILAVVMLYK